MPRRLHYMMLKRPTLATALAEGAWPTVLALGFRSARASRRKVSTAGMVLSQPTHGTSVLAEDEGKDPIAPLYDINLDLPPE